MSEYDYDYFVIGGGSGGVRSARIASQHGANVAIAEGADWGGTCVNVGCVPKKLMSYASDYGMGFEDARGYGWSFDNLSFDWKKLIENKDKEINRLNIIYKKILQKNNVTIYSDFARFIDKNTLQVGNKKVTADKILIATGGTPRKPDMEGHENVIISDEIFHLKENPGKTILIGGGYISVEFAHILHGIGCEVEILYRGSMFLRGFDDDLRLGLAEEMKNLGVKLHFDCDVKSVTKENGQLIVHTTHNTHIECDTVFSSIGRIPNTKNLGLDSINLATDKQGYITVDQHFKTSIDNIYAVGDVTNTPHLTPVAIVEGHYLADTLFGSKPTTNPLDYTKIPTAVFSAPPIGTIGLSEDEARNQGYDLSIFRTSFTPMVHQLSGRDEKTMMKIIVDKQTDKVLGLHILGKDAPEILQGFAVAIQAGLTKTDFDKTLAIHPTSAEELVTLYTPAVPAETAN